MKLLRGDCVMINDKSFINELLSSETYPNILLLLSGGKDSVCCLYWLSSITELHVEALFFKHDWGSSLSYQEAKRHCEICKIRFHVIDFTPYLQRKLKDFSCGRPCLICKPIMYQLAIDFAMKNQFTWIATGDNKSDATTINRLKKFNTIEHERRIFCSRYLAGEQGLSLPDNLFVVRPLLDTTSSEIEDILSKNHIEVKRNYSTGDKYFDYSREGCCLQFCDPGTILTLDVCERLYRYNDVANEWGKKYGIRTSVHVPSTFIVTIPPGYEKTVSSELISHGLPVKYECNLPYQKKRYISVAIEHYPDETHSPEIFLFLVRRYAERLDLIPGTSINDLIFFASNEEIVFVAFFLNNALMLNFQHACSNEVELHKKIYCLCIEIFHTRAISINGSEYKEMVFL